jgi:hypothetical protein
MSGSDLPRGIRALARAYPWTTRFVWGVGLLILGADLFLVGKRVIYAHETSRLRAGMSAVERSRIDAAMRSNSNRLQVMIELARRQARVDAGLHLSVPLDSGVLYLEQDGAVLRAVRAETGADAWVHVGRDSIRVTAPRGTRTIEQVAGDTAILLNGGAVIYASAPPGGGAPADGASSPVRPGSVRIGAADLKALLPNLRPGQRVYFY